MHIAYIGPIAPIPGGISQHGNHLIGSLRKAGHQVDVWSWRSQYPSLLYRGVSRDPEATAVAGARHVMRWWNPASWIRVGVAARKADLIIVQWVTPFHGIPLAAIMRILRPAEVVCVVHNVLPHERLPMDIGLTKLALRQASRAVTHSSVEQESLHQLLPGLPARIVAMPPHLTRTTQVPPPKRPPLRLIQPGYVRPYKGVFVALEAVRRYVDRNPSEDVKLTIAGDFWNPTELEVRSRIRELDLEDQVELHVGYLSDSEMLSAIEAHHAALLSYTDATQSGLIPAVLGAGRPIITTNVGGLAEQVRDGVDSIVCPPRNPDAIADAIRDLDGQYLRFQAEAAKTWDSDAWDRVANQVIERDGPVSQEPDN